MSESLVGAAFAARASGLLIALGYLFGLVPGPVVAAVAALALATLGRSFLQTPVEQGFGAAGLALIAGAVGVATLRWGTLELEGLRGAQAVLGATMLVGPTLAAVAAWLGAASGLIGLGLWLEPGRPRDVVHWMWWVLEALAGGLILGVAFWGPAALFGGDDIGTVALDLGRWFLVALVGAVLGAAIAFAREHLPAVISWVAVALGAVAIAVAAGLVRSVV